MSHSYAKVEIIKKKAALSQVRGRNMKNATHQTDMLRANSLEVHLDTLTAGLCVPARDGKRGTPNRVSSYHPTGVLTYSSTPWAARPLETGKGNTQPAPSRSRSCQTTCQRLLDGRRKRPTSALTRWHLPLSHVGTSRRSWIRWKWRRKTETRLAGRCARRLTVADSLEAEREGRCNT